MERGRVAQWFSGYSSALAKRDLRFLFAGLVVSATGSWPTTCVARVRVRPHPLTGLGWRGRPCPFHPALLLSAYGGVLAERTERVRLMFGADLVCALWQGALALVAATGAPLALAFAFAALTSATNVVYSPSVAATIRRSSARTISSRPTR